MTEKRRAWPAIAVAALAGVVALLATREFAWYAWVLVAVAACAVGLVNSRARRLRRSAEPPPEPPQAEPPAEPAPEPARQPMSFAMRLTGNSHLQVVRNPSSEVGPQPLHIPVSGWNLYLEIRVLDADTVVLHGVDATVAGRFPLQADGVSVVPQPGPATVYGEDLAEAYRRGLENYQPIEVPHLEILLDAEPPVIRPARDADGRLARPGQQFPIRLAKGEEFRLVLAPLTDDRGEIRWRLAVDLEWESRRQWEHWNLRLTAETTMRRFHPDGREPEFVPAHETAPHWHSAFPA